MEIIVKNLLKNKDFVEREIDSLINNVEFVDYSYEGKKLVFTFYRPCYEQAKKSRFLLFFPRSRFPIVKSSLEISPVGSVKIEGDNLGIADVFKHLYVEGNNKMRVQCWDQAYNFDISDKSYIKIEDLEEVDWKKCASNSRWLVKIKLHSLAKIVGEADLKIE